MKEIILITARVDRCLCEGMPLTTHNSQVIVRSCIGLQSLRQLMRRVHESSSANAKSSLPGGLIWV